MPILNYTTGIDPWQTVNEITMILAKHGATHTSIRNEGSQPVAISFTIDFKGMPLNFYLPCKVNKVWLALQKDARAQRELKKKGKFNETHAIRVGWRIIKDWVEAQLALVQIEAVTIEEVFMPYLIINEKGRTLSDYMLNGEGLKQLTQ